MLYTGSRYVRTTNIGEKSRESIPILDRLSLRQQAYSTSINPLTFKVLSSENQIVEGQRNSIILCCSKPVLLIHEVQQQLLEDQSILTFPPFMPTFRCKPRIAASCHGRAAQKENKKTLGTLTPMQYYVSWSHNIKEVTLVCVYTID